jgi:membrane associated rhomboid family serine protease
MKCKSVIAEPKEIIKNNQRLKLNKLGANNQRKFIPFMGTFAKKLGLTIGKGILDFKRVFVSYIIIFLTCAIVFLISELYPSFEVVLSASRSTPWGIISSIFTHSSLSNLLLNMGALFFFMLLFAFCFSTFTIESKKKVEFYSLVSIFVFAIISNVLWLLFTSESSVGASGLVYAVEGTVMGFSLSNSFQIAYFSKLKTQSLTTLFMLSMNLVVFGLLFYLLLRSPNIFLSVGVGVNVIAHGVSFLLGFLISPFWYYVIGKISILN